MKHPLRHWFAAAFAIATLTVAQSARAEFDIVISSGGTDLFTIVDDTAFDTNTPVPHNISVSGSDLDALNAALSAANTGITFTSLGATNNIGTVGPNGIATLDVTGRVEGTGSIQILVSATDFINPTGDPKSLVSSASDTFGTTGTATRNFTSYYNPSNSVNATEFGTSTLVFAPTPGTFSTSGTAPTISVSGTTGGAFGLTNVTMITLDGSSDQFTGKTSVAVPEPTSMALLLVGGSALAFRSRRRLKSTS